MRTSYGDASQWWQVQSHNSNSGFIKFQARRNANNPHKISQHGSKLILSVGIDSHQHRKTIESHQFCHHKSEIEEGASSKIMY